MKTRAVCFVHGCEKRVTLIKNCAWMENKMLRQKYIAQIAQNFKRLFMSARISVFKKVHRI